MWKIVQRIWSKLRLSITLLNLVLVEVHTSLSKSSKLEIGILKSKLASFILGEAQKLVPKLKQAFEFPFNMHCVSKCFT